MSFYDFATYLIAAPITFIGLKQFWDWLVEFWQPKTDPIEVGGVGQPTPSEDRVLIILKRDNLEKTGSLENQIVSFTKQFPKTYSHFGLISHPEVIEHHVTSGKLYAAMLMVGSGFLCLASLHAVVYLLPSQGSTVLWSEPFFRSIALSAIMIVALGTLIASFKRYLTHLRAGRILEEYKRFFRSNGLDIGVEVTQLRSIHEARVKAPVGG